MTKNKPEKEWISNGLKCHVMRCEFQSGTYHRCGYVTLPKNHICYEFSYDDVPVEVHGGLTYGGKDCYGFDCGHAGDRSSDEEESRGHFWTLDEVVKETNKLAEQLNQVTIEKCVDHKLEYMPDWFKNYVRNTISRKGST